MLKRLLPALFAIPLFLGGGADAQSGKVAMLLPGSINDQSWNAAGYAGLVKLKETSPTPRTSRPPTTSRP